MMLHRSELFSLYLKYRTSLNRWELSSSFFFVIGCMFVLDNVLFSLFREDMGSYKSMSRLCLLYKLKNSYFM